MSSKGVQIRQINKDGSESPLQTYEGPIQWEPEYALNGLHIDLWVMAIPLMLGKDEVGKTLIDIAVTPGGLLTGIGDSALMFGTKEEAMAYAEATFRLKEANDGE